MSDRDYMQWNAGGGYRESFWSMYRGTKLLIISMIVIHVLMAIVRAPDGGRATWIWIVEVFGVSLPGLLKGWIWQLVTSGFLHEPGVMHLLFNCIFLWIFGRMVESRLTFKQFMVFCAMGIVSGSVLYVLGAAITGSSSIAIGASGLCMALTVLAACWNPRMEIYFWGIFRLQLWVLAAVLVLIDLIGALERAGSGVAYMAHLGGALYGWIYFKFGGKIEGVFDGIDRMADKAAEKKQRKIEQHDREVRAEVDRILDKVNREGMTSLTDAERDFLKNASKKYGR